MKGNWREMVFYKPLVKSLVCSNEINMNLVISPKKQKQLAKKGYNAIDTLSDEEDEDAKECAWFIAEAVSKLKTKTGKDYLSITVSGLSGQQEKLKVWNWTPEYVIEKNKAYLAIVKKDKWGFSTKINDIMVLPRN